MKLIRNIMILAALLIGAVSFAQPGMSEGIAWSTSVQEKGDGVYTVLFTGKVPSGHYTYTLKDEYSATAINDLAVKGGELVGEVYETGTPTTEADGSLHYYGTIELAQDVKAEEGATVSGSIFSNICTDITCSAQYWDFEVSVGSTSEVVAEKEATKEGKSLWGLIIEAILWGFAMLLTPCVFPMVPMTVSFFMKGSGSVAAGRFKAAMYGLFIILLYTVPISVIIILTRLIGGDAVTADIFNWLSTHWFPNILFFVIFMIFAASFFGAFEIKMPQSLVNKSDQGADKKGLAGVFFMALTLVLVSFSCTGPIIGFLLVEVSTTGNILAPTIGMLGFSIALALPFTLFAIFPAWLKSAPKSGGWMNTVKVVLAFVELAFALKFLSVADLAYGWHILDRETFLALWIALAALLGAYLMKWIQFPHDDDDDRKVAVPRFMLGLITFAFAIYMVPGLWGAPLKAISAFSPPMSTQDFNLYEQELHPQAMDYDQGMAIARQEGKPVMLDFSGYGCVNCREMEQSVLADEKVMNIINNDYVLVTLYVDDKTPLAEPIRVMENGKEVVLRSVGDKWSYLQRSKFGANAQPFYVLLDGEGHPLTTSRSYDEDIEAYINFLEEGLGEYARR